jgi:putative transposase
MLRHLLLALRAFVRLEVYRLRTGVSGYEAQAAIIREAIRRYLAYPLYALHPTA